MHYNTLKINVLTIITMLAQEKNGLFKQETEFFLMWLFYLNMIIGD